MAKLLGGTRIYGAATIDGNVTVNRVYTAQGLFWSGNNNIISTGGGGGAAAGASGQLQFNDGGILGPANLLFDSVTGNIVANAGTASTSTTTGALVVDGGIGVTGNVYTNAIRTTTGIYWSGNGNPIAGITYTASTTPPTGPTKGDQWYKTNTDVLYEYIDDGTTSYWVDILSPSLAANSSTNSSNLVVASTTTSTSITTGALVVKGGAGIAGNINVSGQANVTYTPASTIGAAIQVTGKDTIGGTGYFDFLKTTNITSGATNPNKSFRLNSTGALEVINSAYTSTLFQMQDNGDTTLAGNLTVSGSYGITMTNRPAFRVQGNGGAISATTTVSGGYLVVDYNQGSHLNTTTGLFTAPVAGLYQVNIVVRTNSNSNSGINQIIIRKTAAIGGAVTSQIMIEYGPNTSMNHAGGSTVVKMAVGDTLKFDVTAGTISFDGNDNWSVAYIG